MKVSLIEIWEIGSVAAELLLDRGVMISPIVEIRRYFQDNVGFLPFYRNIAREGCGPAFPTEGKLARLQCKSSLPTLNCTPSSRQRNK